MSRESIADWEAALLEREPSDAPADSRPRCHFCNCTLLSVADRTAMSGTQDDNHQVPWQTKQIGLGDDKFHFACEICFTTFTVVNDKPGLVEAQKEYLDEQARKQKMIRGN